jgi:hypothetical protein
MGTALLAQSTTQCPSSPIASPNFVLQPTDSYTIVTCQYDSTLGVYVLSIQFDWNSLKAWILGTVPINSVSGRYVRVQLLAVGYLSLAEVQIYAPSGTADLALNAPATESTIYANVPTPNGGVINPVAGLAVDGNTDGQFFDGSVTHTDGTDAGWWQVDLGMSQPIGSIIIWNRTDCCESRLANYLVSISNNADGSAPVWSTIQTEPPSPSTTIYVQ